MPIRRIITLNVLGLLILASWLLPATHTIWTSIDNTIFFGVNATYTPAHPVWDTLMAALNTRYYDVVSFLLMVLILLLSLLEDKRPHRLSYWFSVGVVMLCTAGILALFNHKIVGMLYSHGSPTYYYSQLGVHINRVIDLVSFKSKDSASSSFPGDHGMMLMVFASYVMRFSTRRWAVVALIMVPLLSSPRILVGAHWFEDVWMGSLSLGLIILPWVVLTPLASSCVHGIQRLCLRGRHTANQY